MVVELPLLFVSVIPFSTHTWWDVLNSVLFALSSNVKVAVTSFVPISPSGSLGIGVESNNAVYVASPVTAVISGSQPLNEYAYCSSASFVGVAPLYAGVAPYATSLSCNTVPSSLTNLIVYLLTVDVYVAVYVASAVTEASSLSQSANV